MSTVFPGQNKTGYLKTSRNRIFNKDGAMNHFQKRLHQFSKFTAIATFFLLCAGALVTSTGSGLAVPDWPLSFGKFFPPMIGGVVFEHGHRMIAGAVGTCAMVLCVWILMKEKRRWVRIVSVMSVLTVAAQAVLGGLTVLFLLPDVISISHAGLAEIFFCLMISLAVFTSQNWFKENAAFPDMDTSPELSYLERSVSLRFLSAMMTSVIYIQILLGAYFRHANTGVSMHVAWAIIVAFFVGWMSSRILRNPLYPSFLVRLVLIEFGLLIVQFILGPSALVAKLVYPAVVKQDILKVALTAGHLAIGALMLATSLILTLWCFKMTWASSERRFNFSFNREMVQ